MKKYGKYEKMPDGTRAKQPTAKSMLLQTYFTSLICLVLCVTMFFGTSYAWFTSEVENVGNEIYIGTLDVELEKQVEDGNDEDTDPDYVSLSKKDGDGNNVNKLFAGNVRWEPGYTALETIKVTNKGDLAFKYVLSFTDGEAKDAEGNEATLADVARYFDVWVYDYYDNKDKADAVPNPASYTALTAAGSGWVPVGSLDELLAGKSVLEGNMVRVLNKETGKSVETADTYTIALHMKEEATKAVMNHKIQLNVKLVAYQLAHEEDGFGNSQYDDALFVSTVKELQKALDNASGNTVIVLGDDIVGDVTVTQKEGVKITIDGNGNEINGSILVDGKTAGFKTAGLTIRNVNFVNSTASAYSINAALEPKNETRYASNLVVENCTFTMTGGAYYTAAAVKLYQPYGFTMKNCTVTGAHSVVQNTGGHDGITVENVTATDCKNGIAVGTMDGAISIRNCKINVSAEGYGIRMDASVASSGVTISDCKIDAYIPVVIRKATGTYTITFKGKNTMTHQNGDGLWCVVGDEEYGEVTKAELGVVTGTITVELEDTGLASAGVYTSK